MNKYSIILFLCLICTNFIEAQTQEIKQEDGKNYYQNPIFSGDYPDPSILVDGDDYYVVFSSFEYYPGLTIWHSKDLINWNPVANALKKYVGSVWAPDLVKYDGKYYIYFPANETNYVVTADSITGPWSDPVDLKTSNIDPGHVVDASGNRYLYFNNGGYVPLSKDGLSVTGKLKHSYDGWPIPKEWSIECFCMEGPKLFKRGDYYYLTVAQGGTAGPATGHMVVSARSKSPLGPWENSPYNPIVRAQSDQAKWKSVGHGTIFEGVHGKWWMIFHGYEKDHYNMGRQTLLTPIEWKDGWFKIPDNIDIKEPIEFKNPLEQSEQFTISDDFKNENLHKQWKFFGEFNPDRYSIENQQLTIAAKGNSIADSSPLLTVPADHSYRAEVELEVKDGAMGGLVLFYNQRAYSGILADNQNILANLRGWQFVTEAGAINNHVFLRLENRNNTVDFYYSTDGDNWQKIDNSAEVSAFHHNVLSGFMSLRIGLVSIGNKGEVTFKNFTYKPLEE